MDDCGLLATKANIMKPFQRHVNSFSAIACILLAAVFWTAGCATNSNPIEGWMFRPFPGFEMPPYGHNTNHLDKAITDDCHTFIVQNKLYAAAITGFYEDGTGQHAVQFEAFPPNQNASWNYVLIYDKYNKRVKTIKYGRIRYQS
jgi:hypothetical protein